MTTLDVDATTTAGSFTVRARFSAETGVTVLFGPSGSGKSLTLATIAGLLRPSAGTVTIHGRLVADPANGVHVPTQRRHIGMVFQQAALLPHRNPVDNVALAVGGVAGRAGRRAVAQEVLERVGAGHLSGSPTSGLSGGERQRVALARALAGGPRLLLLDEPFSALDQPSRTALRQLLRDLVADLAIPAVLVTHDLDDTTLADRVVVYEPGATTATHTKPAGTPLPLADLLGRHGPDER